MIASRSCPRCRGDIYFGPHGDNLCLQCGLELRPQEQAAFRVVRPGRSQQMARMALMVAKEGGCARPTA